MLVRNQVEVALSVTRLHILKSVPFFRQGPERFREQLELVHLERRLAGLGEKAIALDADEIAEIDEFKQFDDLRTDFFCVEVNLDPPRRIPHIDKMAFPHVAV